VAKALTVFVTIVLPPVAYHALVGQHSDWQTYGIFALQMLLFSLLLGVLAGDYLLLRRVGWAGVRCWTFTTSGSC
jgi:hypothetical protein